MPRLVRMDSTGHSQLGEWSGPGVDYERAVEGLGAKGFALRNAAEIPSTLAAARAALAEGHPALVNAHIGRSEFRKGSLSM